MTRTPKEFPKKTIAAIDIGTNSAHMVVAEMDHVGEMRILDSDKVTLRLGQAIDAQGNLSDEAMKRTVECLRHMRQISDPYSASLRAVATHAMREARNHKRLLREIETAAGIKVELIDGIEEARLTFLGMRYGMALNGLDCLGVDVGGGSTEVIIAKDDDIAYVSSLKIGAVTLTNKYFNTRGNTPEALADLIGHVRSRLAPLPHEAETFTFSRALASSGTAKALAFMHARQSSGKTPPKGDPNGYILPHADLAAMTEQLCKLLTPSKIKDATGLDGSRAEIILAGAVTLTEVSRLLRVKEWVVTSYGLREGLVADTFYRVYGERASGELPDIQWHSVQQFARRLRLDESHSLQVKRLALRLCRQLTPFLRPQVSAEDLDADLLVLKAAAYLREAGKFLSAPQYHRHSQYLIANSRLPGFTESERLLMGLIARFHRKGLPTEDSEDCRDLGASEVKRLRFLAAVVRLAAALDRTRQSLVEDAEVSFAADGKAATVTLHHKKDNVPDVEMHKAKLEQSALEKSWGVSLNFVLRPQTPNGGR